MADHMINYQSNFILDLERGSEGYCLGADGSRVNIGGKS